MPSDFTRVGARRAGDEYQDIVALDVLVEMLEHPDRYSYVEVEAYQDARSLDDVVAVQTDGTVIAKQVKFSTDPSADDDPWTWDDLLRQDQGKNGRPLDSLLQKWHKSVVRLESSGVAFTARVISNRMASSDLARSLTPDGTVDLDRVSRDVQPRILAQIGSDTEVRQFFSKLAFELDMPGLEVMAEAVHRRFCRLGGDDEGWYSLEKAVRHWVCHRTAPPPNGRIRLEDVKAAAKWRRLETLPQDFDVPDDYVLPSQSFLDEILTRIASADEACTIITGRPGVGKSTFLSYLYKHLQKSHTPVVRHHYFLSTSVQSEGRFDHRRIASSLMHDLSVHYPESIRTVSGENPNVLDLGKWIRESAAHFKEQGKCLVVIIDGLDHVWREKESLDELNSLLEHFLPIPDGLTLLLGTQPLPREPMKLLRTSPDRLDLPLLDETAVGRWVECHLKDIPVPENEYAATAMLTRIRHAFFSRSEGHPLHLTYTLRALLEQGVPVTPESIERLPGCSHQDISTYYDQLWASLDGNGQEILHLLAATQFPWKPEWIIECLDPDGQSIATRDQALKQTRHLLVDRGLGLLPFHSSIFVYVQRLDEHRLYSLNMKKRAITWLQNQAPEYWKWAYEWILRADIGDTAAIVTGPSREWIVNSIERAYPEDRTADVLARSAWTTLRDDLPRCVEVGLLNDYLYNTYHLRSEVLDQLLYAQLHIEQDPYLMPRLEATTAEQSDDALLHITERARQLGNNVLAQKCCDELYRRIFARNEDLAGTTAIWDVVDSFLEASGHDELSDPEQIAGFIMRNRDNGDSCRMFASYARGLCCSRSTANIRQLLGADMAIEEREVILEHASRYALREGLDLMDVMSKEADRSNPYVSVYHWVMGSSEFAAKRPEFPGTDWLALKEYEQFDQTGMIEENYRRLFWTFLSDHLWDHEADHAEWLERLGRSSYSTEALFLLEAVAGELAGLLRAGTPPSFGWIYDRFVGLARPAGFRDKYANCVANVINRIALDVLYLNGDLSNRSISRDDLESALRSEYLIPPLWTRLYLSERSKLLDDTAVKRLISCHEEELNSSISQFGERAEMYSVLAGIAALHGLTDESSYLVHPTADNLLTYGGHKDVLLFGVLDAIEACHVAGMPEARDWLISLAPVIAEVGEFTDGDETGALPRNLGETLVRMAPDLVAGYHQWLVGREEYYDSLSVIHAFVRYADLSDPVNKAVAATAVDDESIIILTDRASGGDPHAAEVVAMLRKRFGHDDKSVARIRADLDRSSGSGLTERQFPPPEGYPPGQLKQYIEAAQSEHGLWRKECIEHWLTYWVGQNRHAEVLADVQQLTRAGAELGNKDIIHDLVLRLLGRGAAYQWLVEAHREGYGWNRYWVAKGQAVSRWERVKQYYPDKWYDFILDTSVADRDVPWQRLGFYERVERLVEYCLFFGELELARQIMEKVLDVVSGLVSPLKLPVPEWVLRHE